MLFYSPKHSDYQYCVTVGVEPEWDQASGLFINKPQVAVAEFGSEMTLRSRDAEDPNLDATYMPYEGGTPAVMETRRGHVFNSDEAAEIHGWSEETKRLVETRLLQECRLPEPGQRKQDISPENPGLSNPSFTDFQLVEPKPLDPPWPTYEKAHPKQIAELAEQLGLVEAALFYEQRTKRRQSVVEMLQKRLEEQQAEEALTAA